MDVPRLNTRAPPSRIRGILLTAAREVLAELSLPHDTPHRPSPPSLPTGKFSRTATRTSLQPVSRPQLFSRSVSSTSTDNSSVSFYPTTSASPTPPLGGDSDVSSDESSVSFYSVILNDHPLALTDEHSLGPNDDHPLASTDEHSLGPNDDHPLASTDEHSLGPNDDHPLASTDEHSLGPNDDHPLASTDEETSRVLVCSVDGEPVAKGDICPQCRYVMCRACLRGWVETFKEKPGVPPHCVCGAKYSRESLVWVVGSAVAHKLLQPQGDVRRRCSNCKEEVESRGAPSVRCLRCAKVSCVIHGVVEEVAEPSPVVRFCGLWKTSKIRTSCCSRGRELGIVFRDETKVCARCGALVQKTYGCRHMTCVCGWEWFWCCGRSFRQEERAHLKDPLCQ